MADKEILARIKDIEQRRPWEVYDCLDPANLGHAAGAADLAHALDELQTSFTEAADLYATAKLKGAQSTYIVPLRHAAAEVAKVAAALRQPRPGATTDAAPMQVKRCPGCDVTAGFMEPHEWIGGEGGATVRCPGRPAPHDLTGLDQLIKDSAAAGRGHLREGETFTVLNVGDEANDMFPGQVTADEVTAYLSGAVDTLPGLADALVPGSVHDQTAIIGTIAQAYDVPVEMLGVPTFDLGPLAGAGDTPRQLQPAMSGRATAAADRMIEETLARPIAGPPIVLLHKPMPPTWESETMTADGHRPPGLVATLPPVPLLGQPGDAGKGYDPNYIPPGGVPYSFAELMTPVPYASLPPHLSHSQMETVGDCPAKYRMQRVETDGRAPEIPQWALIGGNAFHAAVETIEREVVAALNRGPNELIDASVYDVESAWRAAFDAEISRIEQSSPVPRSLWRASKKGAEGETWWNANGPEMLRKYLAARPDEPTMVGATGQPCIEAELQVSVPTPYGPLPFKSILDRATLRTEANGGQVIVIRDYKTGDRMPDGPEQLAEQAWTLALHSGFTPETVMPGSVFGTYYNARKGTWTEPVDLLAEYSFEWFVYQLTSAHAQKLALTTGPTPARKTSFCGGCSVKWACPIGGPKRG